MKGSFFAVLLISVLLWGSCSKTAKSKNTSDINGGISPLMSLCQNIDYSDTASLHDVKTMTRIMVDMVKLLRVTDSLTSKNALTVFFNGIRNDEKCLTTVDSLGNLSLNSPASPVRDEILYARFLNAMLSVDSIPEALRIRAEYRYRKALMNRRGSIANDLKFIERGGKTSNLHSMKDNMTLLVFYDPECPHCGDILAMIANSKKINSLVEDGFMTVLAIYTEGKRDVWERTKKDMPDNWLVGYDTTGVLDNDLYDIPAMPTIYLLDSDHRVLLKDPDVPKVISLLSRVSFQPKERGI